MKKISFGTLILLGTILSLSSCMMMGPSHHTMADYDQNNKYYDPVCGHQIDTISPDLSYQYEETEYYFHSKTCMNSFKENPTKYLHHNKQNAYNYFYWGMGSAAMAAMMILMIF